MGFNGIYGGLMGFNGDLLLILWCFTHLLEAKLTDESRDSEAARLRTQRANEGRRKSTVYSHISSEKLDSK